VSRRAAAALKRDELAAMERERRAACSRVEVTSPGVVRGFDAMHVTTASGRRFALVAADACVAYRTSVHLAARYDGAAVAAALAADFAQHGAPLVCRLDRASCHRTDDVAAVLASHGVLALHGPPRHPGYYGQLERQNRDHRAWLRAVGDDLAPGSLVTAMARMRSALNETWRRRSLDWRTAAEIWALRPTMQEDRIALHDEVTDRAARLRADDIDEDLAMRLAIEKALTDRGYLRVTPGRRVLCE
jgi:transposase InsO family protein